MNGRIILYDPSFPMPEGGRIGEEVRVALNAAGRAGESLEVVRAEQLAEKLQTADGGCFVNLHAPFFPKSAWTEILSFLRRGGGLISAGGAPFTRPVRREGEGWKAEPGQTAYHQELHIHEALPVDGTPIERLRSNPDVPLLEGREELMSVADAWNLVPHVTKSSDLPHQMGSAGPMDTRIVPLVKGISAEGREVAAPVVLWEHVGGPFVGGRWLFVSQPLTEKFWQSGGAAALLEWTAFCAKGVTDLWLKPNYASYEPGERATLTLQTQKLGRFKGLAASGETWSFDLLVEQEDGEGRWTRQWTETVTEQMNPIRIPVPLDIDKGFYRVVCRAQAQDGETRVLRQGFWGHDDRMLEEGSPVACGRDYFRKDGRPMPIVGMTYMASDVARKFLFLPNAAVWDRDMAQMRKAGINWIRTGLWTAYRNVMQVDGHVSEEVMRAIDAFIMTAKKNELQVTFTFFSFTPEIWEGANPYLDPRSVEAQKRFVRQIVSRHQRTTNVDWDLINEPSMFDPARIFADGPRFCRDPYEQAAFSAWLEERHESIEALQERWNMTPAQLPDFASARLPEPEEINFDVQDMHQAKKGTRWLDCVLFSMEMHNRWAGELYRAIKDVCPEQLVTVGQDEALGAQRPSPFFYAETVDYTTVHSWWLNDHLVWDGVFAKTPDKPNVIQETGIMYVETPDGRAKRSEAELRNILERKYAYAFATGGAGAIQWIWNTNFYMDNANESHIGALRADGTEKPEADVSYGFGRFMEEIRDLFQERKLEEIAVVFPYSNDFSNRKLAFDATTRAARVLAYELKLPFRGVGEYHLDSLERDPAKLLVLPSPHNLDDAAFSKLADIVRRTGATLLWTGPAGIDAYWRMTDRLSDSLGPRRLANVLREEELRLDGRTLPVSYGARRIAEVCKEIADGPAGAGKPEGGGTSVVERPLGRGRLLWCPLPLELNDRYEPVAELYRYAAAQAGCGADLEWVRGGELAGVYGRKLSFAQGALFVFVSEHAADASIAVRDGGTGRTYSFVLEQERSVLFAVNASGQVMSVYRPREVQITATG